MKNYIVLIGLIFLFQKKNNAQIFIDTNADLNCKDNVDLTLVESNFQNNGTFTPGTGTVIFKETNGSSNSEISGTSTTEFHNLTLDLLNQDLQLMQSIDAIGTILFNKS